MNDSLLPDTDPIVALSIFEGPLDLLLHLVKLNEINLLDLPMEGLTRQYLATLRTMGKMELPLAGEYFVMAAELLRIKSQMLLPEGRPHTNKLELDSHTGPDPRAELVRQLIEYQALKANATLLEAKIEEQSNSYVCLRAATIIERPLKPVDRFELMGQYSALMRRLLERIAIGEIALDEYTISQAIEQILHTLQTQHTCTLGQIINSTNTSLLRLAALFVAVLELTRLGEIEVNQLESCGEVSLTKKIIVA